jgi:iron complex outermembrane receptor protein
VIVLALFSAFVVASAPADSAGRASDAARHAAGNAGARDTILRLPEIRVDRERPRMDARRRMPTAFVSDLATGASGRALETLSDVLSQAASARVVQYGGLGAFSTVSLRGAPSGEVAVYLDGSPVNSAAGSVVNLSDLPSTAVERIEVYRGSSPLGFGAGAPGGAINLVTLASPERLDARVTRGSFDTWEGRATAGARRGRVAGLLHASYQGSAGNYSFHDDNGTPFNLADDSTSLRVNNRFDALTGLATLSAEPARGVKLTARENVFREAHGVPGLGATPARHAQWRFLRSISEIEAASEARRALPFARLTGALSRVRSRALDRTGELGLGRHDTDDGFAGEALTLGLGWPRLLRVFSLESSGALREERATLHDALDGYPDPPQSVRSTRGAMVALRARPFGDRLVMHAARRWDHLADRLRTVGVAGIVKRSDATRTLNAPQLGAWLSGPIGLELKANWARAQRAPDFLELFGNEGSVLGNAALKPEHGENWDAGARWSRARGAFSGAIEWAHFQSRPEDLILFVRNSQSSVRAQNVSRADIRGEEFSLELRSPGGLTAGGALTLQRARDRGIVPAWYGKRLPQRPERVAGAQLQWRRARFGAATNVQYIGDNFLDAYNRQRVTSRTLIGASLSAVPWAFGPRLTLESKNLGNRRATDVAGFPLPGRSVFVSCEARLGPADHARTQGE